MGTEPDTEVRRRGVSVRTVIFRQQRLESLPHFYELVHLGRHAERLQELAGELEGEAE